MSKTPLAGLLAFAVLVFVSLLRAAEETPVTQSTQRVVLIGIGEYAAKQIKPRPQAEDDGKALYDLFTSKDYLGADSGDASRGRCREENKEGIPIQLISR